MKLETGNWKLKLLSICFFGILIPAYTVRAYEYPQKPLIGNFARAIITEADGLAVDETDLTVSVVTNFPTIGSTNEYYYLVLIRTADNVKEIVRVTACDTGTKTLTVERAQDGTSATTFSVNDRVELWVTAGLMQDYRAEQRGYVEEKAVENALDLTAANEVISNILFRLSAVVGTGKLDIATFDASAFSIDLDGNISIKAGGIKTEDFGDLAVTGEKVADATLPVGKINAIAGRTLIGNTSAGSAVPGTVAIINDGSMATASSNNIPTAFSVKTYADAKAAEEAKNYSMQASGSTVFSGEMPTSWTDLDLSGIIGTNRCFVFLFVKTDVSNGTTYRVTFRENGETTEVYHVNGDSGASGGEVMDSSGLYIAVTTDTAGVVEWRSETPGYGGTTVKLLCYQVLN